MRGPKNGWSPAKSKTGGGTLALKLTATTLGFMRLGADCVKETGITIPKESDLFLRPGDLLFQRGNTREYVGIAAIFDGPPETYIYPDLLIRVVPRSPIIGTWLWRVANSPIGRSYMMTKARGAAGSMPKITGEIVRHMPIPCPPEEEMKIALERLDAGLTSVRTLQAAIERQSAAAAGLRQAVLAAAFRGELIQ